MSDWATGKVCTQLFLEMAEKGEQLNTLPRSRRIAHNTHDVFLIGLLSEGYGLATHFEPRKPLIAAYQAVLTIGRAKISTLSHTPWVKLLPFI
ncbi:hypothetical protein ACI6Q5_12050 [Xanthomonas codiaei]|uniref:Uncharacterized protein n=1 Tax=Xanthomonas codiaei TaxID=56463 RepID=A0ABW9MN65_9XANT